MWPLNAQNCYDNDNKEKELTSDARTRTRSSRSTVELAPLFGKQKQLSRASVGRGGGAADGGGWSE